ncbi:MAG TPA: FecR domain-containing protein [Desulfurivibrionaceae bacterium]|nr:FecR domain-containing protein [Desulfurivibrionaceae bacterium]
MTTKRFLQMGLVLLALGLPVSLYAASVGNFTTVTGPVTVTRAGKSLPAAKDAAVEAGDVVAAGEQARAEVRFVDGTIMRVARNSKVEIDKYLVQGQRVDVKLKLATGTIQNIVAPLPGRVFGKDAPNRFEVDTPTATCGVRGTDFITSYQNGVSQTTFLAGAGYAFNIRLPQQVVAVSAGQTMEIRKADAPPVVRPATPVEMSGKETAASAKEKDAKPEEAAKKEEPAAKPEEKKDAAEVKKAEAEAAPVKPDQKAEAVAPKPDQPLAFTPAETPKPPKINVQAVMPPNKGTISKSKP